MYRSSVPPLVLRITTIAVLTVLLTSIASPFIGLAAASRKPHAHTNHSKDVTSAEIADTLRNTVGVLDSSANTPDDEDTDSNAAELDNVDIPTDASDGVSLTTQDGQTIAISLPNADDDGDGQQVAPGVTAYAGSDGSANAVQTNDDGSVRMLTVIDNSSAPTTYDYGVAVPEGGRIAIGSDGTAQIFDSSEDLISFVGTPWARDANGRNVKTWFTTDGTTLTQHIKHHVTGVAYPITADPWWNPLSWFSSVTRVTANVWNDREMRRNFLISAGCALGAATAVAALATGAGAPVATAVFIGLTSYGGCQILTRI